MARSRRSGFQRTSGSRRRNLSWEAGPRTGTPPSVTAAGNVLIANGSQVSAEGLTLMRLRGELLIWLSTVTTILDGYTRVGAGVCIVSENAFGIGVTAVPAPIADMAWDGWWWHSVFAALQGPSTTETGREPAAGFRVPIDTKSMRKVKETDVVIAVVEFGTEVGTAIAQLSLQTRMLVMGYS